MADETVKTERVRNVPLYWLWFSLLPGLSAAKKRIILAQFKDPEEIYRTEDYSYRENITLEMAEALKNKDLTEATRVLRACSQKRIGILAFTDTGYPSRLRNIDDPPLVLFYKGILPDFETQPVIGVVGTRKATGYGLTQARSLAQQVTACGGLVVSGGAAGVDTFALRGAMEAGGQTVAVLGCGVDVVYPKSNKNLFDRIEECGCLISEYIPGTEPYAWQFPRRNRIISGMSNGILVVEAPEKSGALITATEAMKQGRDIFVIPCNIDIPTGQGSNALMREGAIPVFSGWDVLKDYQPRYPDSVSQREPVVIRRICEDMPNVAQPVSRPAKKSIDNPETTPYSVLDDMDDSLTPEEREILGLLSPEPCPVDVVIAQLDMPAAQVLQILTSLSLRGIVKNHPGRLVSV